MSKIRKRKKTRLSRPINSKKRKVFVKDKNLVWIIKPEYIKRDEMIWELYNKRYPAKVIGELFNLEPGTVLNIYWKYHSLIKEEDDITCDFCQKKDKDDVFWREGLYNLCSDCYKKAIKLREIKSTNRYRAIKYSLYQKLKEDGYSDDEIEQAVSKKNYGLNTPITKMRKHDNKKIQQAVNKEI